MRPTRTTSPAPRRARRRVAGSALAVSAAAMLLTASPALAAQAPVGLGTADPFAVLAGSAVTNTGPSTINGNVGVSPGTAITGGPEATINGTVHAADAVAGQAQTDLGTAYSDAAGRTPPVAVPSELGGLLLTPGVYRAPADLALTGALTLDAQGDPNAVFVFQTASALTTATASRVVLVNGAQACNVTWQVGSSATLGTGSVFVGNLLAQTSISLGSGVNVSGRLLARTGGVTLINDTVSAARCAPGTGPGSSAGAGGGDGGGTGPGGGGTGDGAADGSAPAPAAGPAVPPGRGSAILTTTPRTTSSRIARYGTSRCVGGRFSVVVTGRSIRRVVFFLDDRTIRTRTRAPFRASIVTAGGVHRVTARVFYADGTRAASLRLRFRSCAPVRAAVPDSPSRRPRTPPGFAG
ncbi:ice-binding family protein [Patulibacter americanus]|uniref:ice-binding family protein n=1 Tax=Patulibacter americanus TaxID=588672 RepID=UPI000A064010|nr:ice-binding family protein [Patulibacter americanus]